MEMLPKRCSLHSGRSDGWTWVLAKCLVLCDLCYFHILSGHVNISVTAEAEENHELCGNQIAVTPARGQSDTVVKSVLVKVSI